MKQGIYLSFFNLFFPRAAAVAGFSNIDPLFVLAVAALESAFGKKAPHFNFFGLKASPSTMNLFYAKTKEYDPQRKLMVSKIDSFRSYTGFEESCIDFCRLVKHKYPQCVGVFDSSVCKLLQANPKRKYATDPAYSEKLESLYFIFKGIKERGKV
jgi:flagellar protein FlgJ